MEGALCIFQSAILQTEIQFKKAKNDAKTAIILGDKLRTKGLDVHDSVGEIADKQTLIDFACKILQRSET